MGICVWSHPPTSTLRLIQLKIGVTVFLCIFRVLGKDLQSEKLPDFRRQPLPMCEELPKIIVSGLEPFLDHPSFLCGGMVAKERSIVG